MKNYDIWKTQSPDDEELNDVEVCKDIEEDFFEYMEENK